MNEIVCCYKNNGDACDIDECDYMQIKLLGQIAKESNICMLISKNSFGLVSDFKWYLGKSGYPFTYQSLDGKMKFGRGLKIHKMLRPDSPSGMVVDHINRDKLDNRYENLRICTPAENSYNKTKLKTSKNKYKGIKKINKNTWAATITKDNKKVEIDGFLDEKSAAQTYDMMAEELFGIFSAKNFS